MKVRQVVGVLVVFFVLAATCGCELLGEIAEEIATDYQRKRQRRHSKPSTSKKSAPAPRPSAPAPKPRPQPSTPADFSVRKTHKDTIRVTCFLRNKSQIREVCVLWGDAVGRSYSYSRLLPENELGNEFWFTHQYRRKGVFTLICRVYLKNGRTLEENKKVEIWDTSHDIIR